MTEVLPDIAKQEAAQDPYAELYDGMRELLVGGLATVGAGVNGPERRIRDPFYMEKYRHQRYGHLILGQLMMPPPPDIRVGNITPGGMRGTMVYRDEEADLIGVSLDYYVDPNRYRGYIGKHALGIFAADSDTQEKAQTVLPEQLTAEPFVLAIGGMHRRLQKYRATTGY